MIVYKDIIQGSHAWHELRHGKISGTRNKQLFADTETLFYELLSENMEDYTPIPSFEGWEMQRGRELEPEARELANITIGCIFEEAGWLQHETIDILGLSPDGLTTDKKKAIEIKCLNGNKHTKTIINNQIPKEHINQCLQYFVINKELESLYYISYRPENKIKPVTIIELNRDSLIDIGLTKKAKMIEDRGHGDKEYTVTIPDIKTVNDFVEIAEKKALELEKKIRETIKNIF